MDNKDDPMFMDDYSFISHPHFEENNALNKVNLLSLIEKAKVSIDL